MKYELLVEGCIGIGSRRVPLELATLEGGCEKTGN